MSQTLLYIGEQECLAVTAKKSDNPQWKSIVRKAFKSAIITKGDDSYHEKLVETLKDLKKSVPSSKVVLCIHPSLVYTTHISVSKRFRVFKQLQQLLSTLIPDPVSDLYIQYSRIKLQGKKQVYAIAAGRTLFIEKVIFSCKEAGFTVGYCVTETASIAGYLKTKSAKSSILVSELVDALAVSVCHSGYIIDEDILPSSSSATQVVKAVEDIRTEYAKEGVALTTIFVAASKNYADALVKKYSPPAKSKRRKSKSLDPEVAEDLSVKPVLQTNKKGMIRLRGLYAAAISSPRFGSFYGKKHTHRFGKVLAGLVVSFSLAMLLVFGYLRLHGYSVQISLDPFLEKIDEWDLEQYWDF